MKKRLALAAAFAFSIIPFTSFADHLEPHESEIKKGGELVRTNLEDYDLFSNKFSDDILIASTEKLQFRDTAIYINSSTDGQLDLVADTEIQIAATTVDINGNVDISGTLTVAGALDFGDANISNIGSIALDTITKIVCKTIIVVFIWIFHIFTIWKTLIYLEKKKRIRNRIIKGKTVKS